jgi:nitroreductase
MDVFDAVRTVLAVREYQERPIPAETVRRIVEAGHLTASSQNKQPWHFVVVDDRATLQQMGALARTGRYIAQAPLAIAIAVEKRSRFAVSDASRAAQSMILTAWADGVGSNWVGSGGLTEIAALLRIPDQFDVLSVLAFGYPVRSIGKGEKARKPLSEIASYGQFGQPYE